MMILIKIGNDSVTSLHSNAITTLIKFGEINYKRRNRIESKKLGEVSHTVKIMTVKYTDIQYRRRQGEYQKTSQKLAKSRRPSAVAKKTR